MLTTNQMTARGSNPSIAVYARRLGSWHFSIQRTPLPVEELVTLYDHEADRWHRILERLNYPDIYGALMARTLSTHRDIDRGNLVRALDCGVGTGAASVALAQVLKSPLTVDAVDVSSAMLQRAHDTFSNANISGDFHLGNASALPFADSTFDISMAAHVLEHLDDPAIALSELVRVTRPGGLIVAFVTRRSVRGFLIHCLWRTHMLSPESLEALFRSADLGDVSCLEEQANASFHRRSVACVGIKPTHC